MDAFKSSLSAKFKTLELSVLKTDELEKDLESNLEKFIDKATETLRKKIIINPKPQKRIMRIIGESQEDIEEKDETTVEPAEIVRQKSPPRESLRPVRSAKLNANKNLKERSSNVKMRNDNNVAVIVKAESRDSLKENTRPKTQNERISVDEGIQMGSDTNLTSSGEFRRSKSVEIIPHKEEEIDITDDKDEDKMPPPPIPSKRKKAQKKSNQEILAENFFQPIVRVTRSKIKTEKKSSIGQNDLSASKSTVNENPPVQKFASEPVISSKTNELTVSKKGSTVNENPPVQKLASDPVISSKTNESTVSKKGSKKKCPMPILIKIERISTEAVPSKSAEEPDVNIENVPPESQPNDIPLPNSIEKEQNIPMMNETVTINTNLPVNQTVTLETHNINETYNKNQHDSLMTEDNDEDLSMEIPLKNLKDKNVNLPPKLKKNEVFSPYVSSPVKQKVQAFEKHANATPDISKATTSKFNILKSGTPSKIAIFNSKTTPVNNAKQKYINAITASASSVTSTSSYKKPSKKYTSLSHESNEDLRKNQGQSALQQLEERKRQREEKQRQVQLQREAIEKQKREQTLQQQREREEKFRKIMHEKEEAKRLEALKKKQLKEHQEKKFAEEKAKKEEIPVTKEPQSASKDDSLYIKMQKQILMERAMLQKKKVDKNAYSFDMLSTDDSTDDESHPSKKRPEPPQWSKKQVRCKQIFVQSFANSNLLDNWFSAHPINVNLREIFPAIDARKLVRNSSAVWNSPQRYSQIPKY